jgi:hypothetical protein
MEMEIVQTRIVYILAGRPGDRGSIPGKSERIFSVASVSRPALGPTQPPVQWVPGVLSPRLKRGRGVTLTHSPHLVPRSRMSRSYTSSLPSSFVACSGTALAFLAYTPAFHGETEKKQDKPESRQSVFRIWNSNTKQSATTFGSLVHVKERH